MITVIFTIMEQQIFEEIFQEVQINIPSLFKMTDKNPCFFWYPCAPGSHQDHHQHQHCHRSHNPQTIYPMMIMTKTWRIYHHDDHDDHDGDNNMI